MITCDISSTHITRPFVIECHCVEDTREVMHIMSRYVQPKALRRSGFRVRKRNTHTHIHMRTHAHATQLGPRKFWSMWSSHVCKHTQACTHTHLSICMCYDVCVTQHHNPRVLLVQVTVVGHCHCPSGAAEDRLGCTAQIRSRHGLNG